MASDCSTVLTLLAPYTRGNLAALPPCQLLNRAQGGPATLTTIFYFNSLQGMQVGQGGDSDSGGGGIRGQPHV